MSMKLLIAEDSPDVAEVVAFGARMNWPDCQVTIATEEKKPSGYLPRIPPTL